MRVTVLVPVFVPLIAVLMCGTGGSLLAATEVSEVDLGGGVPSDLSPPDAPDETPISNNPVIDCSTNIAYRTGTYAQFARAVGHTSCASCHRAARPIAGTGDRPLTHFASLALYNKSKEAVKYELRVGAKGEWTEYKIEPGKIQRVAWSFADPRRRQSPGYFVRYEGKEYSLAPLATPNKNLGRLYYFAANAGEENPSLFTVPKQPYRARRH